jgi:hypothetical protein
MLLHTIGGPLKKCDIHPYLLQLPERRTPMENQRFVILNDLLVFQGGLKLGRLTIRQYYKYNDIKAVGKRPRKASCKID